MPVICLEGFFCRLCVRKNKDGGADGRVGEGRQDRPAGMLPICKGEVMNGECRRGQALWCLIWSPPQMGQSMLYHSLSLWERSVCHSELAPAGSNSQWVVSCRNEDCPPVTLCDFNIISHPYPALQTYHFFNIVTAWSHLMTNCYFSFRTLLGSVILAESKWWASAKNINGHLCLSISHPVLIAFQTTDLP